MACLTHQESTLCKKEKKVAKVPTYTKTDKDSVSFNLVFSLNYEAGGGVRRLEMYH